MRLRRAVAGVSGTVLLLGFAAQPASGITQQVAVRNFSFSPSPITAAQGGALTWHNEDPNTHTATGDAPLSLWSTGNIPPGATSAAVTLRAAGTFPYHCSIHASMHGTARVPILVTPSSGTTSTTFTVRVTSAVVAGFTYDIQRRVGTGAWTLWKTGVTSATRTFKAASPGVFSFRSRLVRTSNHAASKWSPLKKVTVS